MGVSWVQASTLQNARLWTPSLDAMCCFRSQVYLRAQISSAVRTMSSPMQPPAQQRQLAMTSCRPPHR